MKYSVEYWRDRLDASVDFGDPSRDTDRCIAWITRESAGNPAAIGTQYEVGIFQIDMQDGPRFGGTIATLHDNFAAAPASARSAASQRLARDLTDDEEALQVSTGLAMVGHYRDVSLSELGAQGLTWSDDDVWCMTKLQHGLPGIPAELLAPCVRALGTGIAWSDFRSYCEGLDSSSRPSNLRGYDFTTIFNNAESVGYLGGIDGGGSISTVLLLVLGLVGLFLFSR